MSRLAAAAYLVFVLAPISAVLYATYGRYSSVIRDEVAASVMQALAQAETNIRYRMDYLADVSGVIVSNPGLREILGRRPEENPLQSQIEDARELTELLRSAQFNRNIERVRLFVDADLLYAAERINLFSLDDIRNRPWFPSVADRGGGIVTTSSYMENFIDAGPIRIVSLLRSVRAPSPFDQMRAILSVDVAESSLREVLAGIRFDRGERIILVDAEGMVLSCVDESLIGRQAHDALGISADDRAPAGTLSRIQVSRADGIPILYLERFLENYSWSLIATVPIDALLARNRSFAFLLALVVAVAGILLLVFVAVLLTARAADRVTRRLREIGEQIERTGRGYLDHPRDTPFGRGDLSRVEAGVDQLLGTVGKLMDEAARARDLEHEAQLTALQAQINPHFLYNTLDSINWMAAKRGAQDIRDLVEALARYFRLALNKGRQIVFLREELELVTSYLTVQRARFGDVFEARVSVPDTLAEVELPKLTLQPLVENALLHGIRHRRGTDGVIEIRGDVVAGFARIAIRDNGPGMPLETAVALSERLRRDERSGSDGYGLQNVNERLRLFFGESSGLSVASVDGEGTEILIRFPIRHP